MDKLKNVAKHGVHPTGDHEIHRKTWKTDAKNIALRRDPNKAHLDQARSHTSAPLSALKDPDSFGPPPKHTGVYPTAAGGSASPSSPAPPPRQLPRPAAGGLGAPAPAPRRRQGEEEEEEEPKPSLPYRTDTTGLRTDNLPLPPARRVDETEGEQAPAPPPRRTAAPSPALPSRPQPQQVPSSEGTAPGLPPRMNEHPDEYTPPAPPPYQEAAKEATPLLNQGALNRLGQARVSVPAFDIGRSESSTAPQVTPAQAAKAAQHAAPLLNQGSLNRLGQAGVSVLGFGIGQSGHEAEAQSPSTVQGHVGQLSELQQRFARMNAGTSSDSPSSPSTSSAIHSVAAAAAAKKAPPPPPPKKPGLADGSRPTTANGLGTPPPLPMASKPRPT